MFTEAPPNQLPPGASPQNWDVDFLIAGVGTRPGLVNPISLFSPSLPSLPVTYLRSTQVLGPQNLTLLEDDGTSLYVENLNTSGKFTSIYANIINASRATSDTVNEREYIPLSNLLEGSDQPRQYDGTNLDRISQVAPGAGPAITATSPTYGISAITEIYSAQTIDTVVWGAYLNTNNAPPASANLYFMGVAGSTTFTTNLNIGSIVYISGVPNMDGQNPNGTYAVTSIGSFTDVNGVHQYFGVTAYVANSDFIRGSSGGTYQITQALVQLSTAIPLQNAVVGGSITIQGASPSQWNNTWNIAQTPTEGQLSISATSLSANVATYDYSLLSGEAPGWQPDFVYSMSAQIVDPNGNVWQVTTPGTSGGTIPAFSSSPQTDNTVTWTEQPSGTVVLATVFNTNNGNGIFNIANQPITSATQTTFTVSITSPNIVSAAEDGNAVTGSGTTLIIDPGSVTLGTGSPGVDPIYGNASAGGDVLVLNALVAAGERYAVLMFLTRNGYITPASPPVSFYTTGATGTITFSSLAIGPADVIARIVGITLANAGIGGPYYWIPDDVIVLGSASSLGISQTFQKTVLDDNSSTSLGPITISDVVLAASENISEVGNNLQQQRELAECVKVVQWAGRTFFLGERTKVDNFINLTFDGGEVNSLPAGWMVSSALQQSVTVVPSPIVNTSVQINPQGAPYLVQSASARSSGASVTAEFITFPPGQHGRPSPFPSPPTPGNTLVFLVSGPYSGAATITPPSGLTLEAAHQQSSGEQVSVYTRTVQSGDPASWTFTNDIGPLNLAMYEIPVPETGSISFSAAANISQAASPTLETTTVSPSGSSLVFCMFAWKNDAWPPASPSPSNYSDIADFAPAIGGPTTDLASVLYANGSSIPSSAISATLAWSTSALFGTLICEYPSQVRTPVNPAGTPLASISCLSQTAYENIFLAPIIEPNTAYSVRVTAERLNSNTGGNLVVDLFSPGLDQNWAFTVPFSSLSTSILEFSGVLNNPLWLTVPSDLQLRVYPSAMAAGAEILIDRVEVFPSQQPSYTTQVAASYSDNTEAIDGVTGAIDTSLLTSQVETNHYVFLNKYYITTGTRTLSPIQSGSGEPDTWTVDEISNAVGCVGPLGADVGEEYVVTASDDGVYIFDGGNHVKITQEIQQIWDSLYEPSRNTIWVLNDLRQQRILVGVPLPTPNQWLPNAPSNTTPETPNVILACSYLGLMTGAEIAAGHAVFPSAFTGNLLFHDMKRKWTIWQIPAATAAWIARPGSNPQIWFGQGGNGVSELDYAAVTDNGNGIVSRYVTYAFASAEDRERMQLNQGRAIYPYALINISGSGQWYLTLWPETLGTPSNPNPYPATQAPFTLENPALDDVNAPLNTTGNRAFIQIDSDGVAGTSWQMSRIDLAIGDDPRMRISGR